MLFSEGPAQAVSIVFSVPNCVLSVMYDRCVGGLLPTERQVFLSLCSPFDATECPEACARSVWRRARMCLECGRSGRSGERANGGTSNAKSLCGYEGRKSVEPRTPPRKEIAPVLLPRLLCRLEFISRERDGALLNDAVQREAEVLIEISKPKPIRDAVQAKVWPAESPCACSGERQQLGRNPLLRPSSPDGQLVNEGRGAGCDLGPEDRILQFEFHHVGQMLVRTCDMEKPGVRVTQNALAPDLCTGPQRSAAIGEPLRGFLQDGGDFLSIRGVRLLDVHDGECQKG